MVAVDIDVLEIERVDIHTLQLRIIPEFQTLEDIALKVDRDELVALYNWECLEVPDLDGVAVYGILTHVLHPPDILQLQVQHILQRIGETLYVVRTQPAGLYYQLLHSLERKMV